jgi:hypothetical protein
MLLPGENSVIVPVASVVVVVLVVCETCAQAKGAAIASAMLNTTFFMVVLLFSILPVSDRMTFANAPRDQKSHHRDDERSARSIKIPASRGMTRIRHIIFALIPSKLVR